MPNWYDQSAAPAATGGVAAPMVPASTMSAADTYANMTRANWYRYMNEIGVPQENKLIEYATDPGVVTANMAEASADATGAFDRQTIATGRRLEGLGLTLNADEQQAADRATNLARSLADVGAQNRAADQTRTRQQSIIGNPAPTIGALR